MGYGDTGLLVIVVPGILTSSLYCNYGLLSPCVYRLIVLNFFALKLKTHHYCQKAKKYALQSAVHVTQ
jgi:hypothetical protein